MIQRSYLLLFVLLIYFGISFAQPARTVYQDKEGVIRWSETRQEVVLFGANYCLPSACDYRAAKYVTNDLKKVVDEDMSHFARMGWEALRLCLWGDFENSDSGGNLIVNDHLDMLDYVIFKAKQRGIYFLFSPIVTYSSQWPDAMHDTTSARGFSAFFKKYELGTNPKAIAAQKNYLRQILNHINAYTGVALKDEPNILFIEMINEPLHHSDDVEGSVKYINELIDAVRSTGCKKILFHNYSQDFNMAKPLGQSKIQGVSFAWYPSGLNSGHTLKGNFLPFVDHYSEQMLRPEISKLSRIVYEFDSPDLINGYMYPAMARAFREVGAQLATMFSYDMVATAPYNLGWQTHCLNLVYTPQKAVSAIIASEVMKITPRFKNYGNYPDNTSFGPFSVDYKNDLSVMNTSDKFMYTGTTSVAPINIGALKKIVGYGSSPIVSYEGKGVYFLDKIVNGVWRLEVYPDAIQVKDPFNMPGPGKAVFRLLHKNWPMSMHLADLGKAFSVIPLNENNSYGINTSDGKFGILPGVYLVTNIEGFKKETLPKTIGSVGMHEFYDPQDAKLPIQVVIDYRPSYYANEPISIYANIYGDHDPASVTLFIKRRGNFFNPIPMKKDSGYLYKGIISARNLDEGWVSYCIVVKDGDKTINYPSGINKSPMDWDFNDEGTWKSVVIKEKTPLRLINPSEDINKLTFTRIGDGIRFGIYKLIPSTENGEAAIRLGLPLNYDKNLQDYTISIPIKDKIVSRKEDIFLAKKLELIARGINKQQQAYITLVENDGTSWSKKIILKPEWGNIVILLNELELSKGVMLPEGYPGEWNYWLKPSAGRGNNDDCIKMENVESIQLSVRQINPEKEAADSDSWIEISSAILKF